MELKHSRSAIDLDPDIQEMIGRGYAHETLVNMAFHYLNVAGEESKTVSERSAIMQTVMDVIADKVPCYQYRDNSLRFNTLDWDLHFYCKIHEDGVPIGGKLLDLSYILLSFNELHDVDKRIAIYESVMDILKPYENMGGLTVVLRYGVTYDHERIDIDALSAIPDLLGKKVTYAGMSGRLVTLSDGGYGFMKNRARTHYYPLTNSEILLLSWQITPKK